MLQGSIYPQSDLIPPVQNVKPKSILVIEDDEVVCQIIQRIVSNLNAQATIVQNGRAALDVLGWPIAEQFDVIVLDLILPQATGWDIIDYIKANSLLAKIPIIVVSGAQLSLEEKNRLTAGGNAFVEKQTFGIESFQNVLSAYLYATERKCADSLTTQRG
jgi:CheY-like chemotaxis protein